MTLKSLEQHAEVAVADSHGGMVGADAGIDENSPGANKGDSVLKVQSKGPGDDFRALVRFTLPAVGEGCGVSAATLRLHSEKDQPGRTLEVRRLATPWSEMGVTWSIRPPTAGEPVRGPAGEGELRFDVTSLVAAGAANSFEIRDAELHGPGAEHGFYSRETGESPPVLVVSFSAL